MKILPIILLFLLSISSFAADIPARINDTLTVSSDISPDIMRSDLNITYDHKDFKSAAAGIEKIAAVIRAHSGTCSYKSYTVSPKYNYGNNKRTLEGYQARLYSPCSFKDIVEYDAVLNDLQTVSGRKPDYQTSVSSVRWVVSENLRKSKTDSLKTEVLSAVETKRQLYSETLSRNCNTSVITFAGASNPVDHPVARLAAPAEAFKSTPPDMEPESISVTAEFTLICK